MAVPSGPGLRAADRKVLARGLLDHYRKSLAEIREAGYIRYWLREFRPYLKGAVQQFSSKRVSSTERLLKRRWARKTSDPQQH